MQTQLKHCSGFGNNLTLLSVYNPNTVSCICRLLCLSTAYMLNNAANCMFLDTQAPPQDHPQQHGILWMHCLTLEKQQSSKAAAATHRGHKPLPAARIIAFQSEGLISAPSRLDQAGSETQEGQQEEGHTQDLNFKWGIQMEFKF
jgi:hypothetical protein